MSRPLTEDIEGVLEQSERPRLQDTQPRDETRKRSMEFDQPGEEELEAAGGGEEVNVISGVEELPDLRPEQQIRDEEEIRTPHVGCHKKWKTNNLVDLRIRGTEWVQFQDMWWVSGCTQRTGTDHLMSGHRYKNWKEQCLGYSGT